MLKLQHLSKTFYPATENEITVLSDLSLEIPKGEFTAIIGGNGSGKSTLLNLISGSLLADSGRILLDQEDITLLPENQRVASLAFVHQNPSLGVAPSLTILENMALADNKCQSFGLRRLLSPSKRQDYGELLRELSLGLEDKLDTKVQFLSGGQRQALSLLMAVMKKPKLLLLDEHTAALDPKTSRLIMDKTAALIQHHAITTVMISHNMRDALEYSQRILMLRQGALVLDEKSSSITEEELQHHWFAA